MGWALAFTTMPALFALHSGQIGPQLLLGAVLFLECERRGYHFLTGAATVLLAIKPHLAYLIWLAWRMGMETFVAWYSGVSHEAEVVLPRRSPFLQGLWCNLLNPKVVIFLAAVSAPFLKGARPDWWPVAMWAVVVVQGAVLWAMWAWLLQWRPLRTRYQQAAPVIDCAFAMTLLALAGWLIVG